MPVVTVLGIPKNPGERFLSELIGVIQDQIAGVKELGLRREAVSVFFSNDLFQPGLGEEICVFIAIFGKPERTDEVLHHMADRVQRKIKKDFFPGSLVEVFPQVLNSRHCSSSD